MGKRMKNRLTLIIFAVALVVMGFFAAQYHLSRLYEQQVEVGYRRALNEFATHMQELTVEMGRARLAISERQCQMVNSNFHRLVYAIQSNMGELPVEEIQLERIANLVNRVKNWDEGEIEELYRQMEYVSHELEQLLLRKEKKYPWVSWQEYLTASSVFPGLLQGLALINAELDDFKKPSRSGEIVGEEISEEQAIEVAREFSGSELDYQIINESTGTIPTYTVEGKVGEENILLEVSKKGGVVLWMISTKPADQTRLGTAELAMLGKEFLEERGFPPLYLTDAQSLQHRVIFTYVPKREEILYYGEPIKVQLSAADGSVLGFWGTPFYLAQSRVQEDKTTIQTEIAWIPREKVRQGVEILDQKFALVKNDQEEEILVQRLGVHYEGDYYLIYLNAQTGEEELIEQVSSSQFF
ncbi:MAG: hypothetical protein GX956_03345 [Firmicutes bacterium]|nr:hypothetical protein [Bacillota bacterium]